MAKDPAFLFYYQDFLVGTDEFTNEEVGAYIRCLCHQAHKGHITERHFNNVCLSSDIQSVVKTKFRIDKNGNLFNKRLKDVVEKRRLFSQSRRENRLGKTKTSE